MTYGDDRTAGAMSDDERRDYVRQVGAAMAAPPDGPSRDLLERCAHAYYRLRWARDDWRHMAPVHREAYYEVADAILAEIAASGYVIVRKRAIGDALSDAIMEATNQGWNDPDSAIWRRGMAAGHRTLGLAWPGDLDPVGGGE